MTKTFRALGVAASLVMGTALAASAAVSFDNQGNPSPPPSSVQPMSPGYQGNTTTPTTSPGYQTSQSSVNGARTTISPHVDSGNPEGAGGGAGGGGGSGGTGH
jgi:hypothetical protein